MIGNVRPAYISARMKTILAFLVLAAGLRADVSLTVEQELALYRSLSSLESVTKMVDNKAVQVPYDFSADVRFSLARDLLLVTPDTKSFEQARVAESNADFPVVTDRDGNRTQATSDPVANLRFQAAMQKLSERKVALPLETVAKGDLKLDTNPFPTQVLAGLMPIIRP